MLHHPREARNDVAALRIVSSHAAEPQAVLLRTAQKIGNCWLLNKFLAFARAENRVRLPFRFEREEQLGAVVVLRICRYSRRRDEARDDRKMLDAHRH